MSPRSTHFSFGRPCYPFLVSSCSAHHTSHALSSLYRRLFVYGRRGLTAKAGDLEFHHTLRPSFAATELPSTPRRPPRHNLRLGAPERRRHRRRRRITTRRKRLLTRRKVALGRDVPARAASASACEPRSLETVRAAVVTRKRKRQLPSRRRCGGLMLVVSIIFLSEVADWWDEFPPSWVFVYPCTHLAPSAV